MGHLLSLGSARGKQIEPLPVSEWRKVFLGIIVPISTFFKENGKPSFGLCLGIV